MKIVFIGANNPHTLKMMNAVNKEDENIEFIGFIDNDENKKDTVFCGLPVFGGTETAKKFIKEKDIFFVNLITRDCATRFETSVCLSKMGAKFANFIHPSVNTELVNMGRGNYIQENVILQAGVRIGNNSSIHLGALISHETSIGSSVFVAHGCSISGLINISDGVFVGAGVTIMPRLNIGKFSVLGAGTVVIRDVPDYSIVVGNPGKVIKPVEKKYENADIFNQKNF